MDLEVLKPGLQIGFEWYYLEDHYAGLLAQIHFRKYLLCFEKY